MELAIRTRTRYTALVPRGYLTTVRERIAASPEGAQTIYDDTEARFGVLDAHGADLDRHGYGLVDGASFQDVEVVNRRLAVGAGEASWMARTADQEIATVAVPDGTLEFLLTPRAERFQRATGSSSDAASQYLRVYPRICAHIIAESLGYATPTTAAQILKSAAEGRENWCEWIYSCYNRDAGRAVRDAIRNRARHEGYMASYAQALALVRRANDTGEQPLLASWF